MISHKDVSNAEVIRLFKQKKIMFGGNKKLKIYGTMHCRSGKTMNRDNRVFFANAGEAISLGYRPCGKCMRSEYKVWKNGSV